MEISVLEWIGYLASVIIAISMAMSSIVKFRVINLIGAALFSLYGVLIGAAPVAALNGFIVVVDIYYLVLIFAKKEVFETLRVGHDNEYLQRFLRFHGADIERFFPGFDTASIAGGHIFLVLRNMVAAGVFIARTEGPDTLRVDLDYVTPQYRDFKNGQFIFHRLKKDLLADGFSRVVTGGHTKQHKKYLAAMGFGQAASGEFEMQLSDSGDAARRSA